MNYYRASIPSGGDGDSYTVTYDMNGTKVLSETSGIGFFISNMYFNNEVIVGSKVNNCAWMFDGGAYQNSKVTFKASDCNRNLFAAFRGCARMNAPIIFERFDCQNIAELFNKCFNLNQSIDMRNLNTNAVAIDSFRNCTNLRKMVYFPYNVEYFDNTFANSAITSAKLVLNQMIWGRNAFRNCYGLRDLYINAVISGERNYFNNMVSGTQYAANINIHFSSRVGITSDTNKKLYLESMTNLNVSNWTKGNDNHFYAGTVHAYFNETINY